MLLLLKLEALTFSVQHFMVCVTYIGIMWKTAAATRKNEGYLVSDALSDKNSICQGL